MALSGNVWLWVHWVSRYTWPTSVGWRAVNGAQVCPPAPPYSMKDNQIDGFVDQIMNHPQIQLSHSPDYLTGPFDILLYSPKQVPFLRQTSHTRRFCAGRERYKVYAGTKAPLRLHEVVVSFMVEKTMTSQSSSICGHLFFLQHLGPQNSPQVLGLLVWETHGSCLGSWGQLLFQSWCVASFNISRFHPTEAEANPSFWTKPTGVQSMHCGTPKSHLGRWGQDGEQLLRQFKRFCSNWLHVFQARGWRWNSPHNFQLICWGIVPSPSVLHSFAIPRYLAKKGPQDTLFSATGVLHRSNQLPQEGHCAEGLVPWWWGGLKSVKKGKKAMRGYPKFYQIPSLYPIA